MPAQRLLFVPVEVAHHQVLVEVRETVRTRVDVGARPVTGLGSSHSRLGALRACKGKLLIDVSGVALTEKGIRMVHSL